MTSEQQDRILRCLNKFPGLTLEEIADKLETPIYSTKTQLYRLRKSGFVLRKDDKGWILAGNPGIAENEENPDTSIVEIIEEYFDTEEELLRSGEKGIVDVYWPEDLIEWESVLLGQPIDMIRHFQDVYRSKFNVEATPFFSFHGVPVVPIGSIGTETIGRMVCVDGDIVGHEQPRAVPIRARVQCPACKEIFLSRLDKATGKPVMILCNNCPGEKVVMLRDSFSFRDEQWFVLEETGAYDQANKSCVRAQLPPELIDHGDPSKRVVRDGNTVRVTGVVRAITRKDQKLGYITSTYIDISCLELLQSDIVHVEVSDEEKTELLEFSKSDNLGERLVACVAPDVYGLELAKRAMLLSSVYLPMDGKRYNVNLLFIGHTGIAKSRLCLWWAQHYPRATYSSGVGSSVVGLFGMAQRQDKREGGRYTILAGTIPRADGGIAVVDEFEKQIAQYGEGMFLECMEHRAVSIQKGDARARMAADCPIWALSNWRNMLPPDSNLPRVASIPPVIGHAMRNRFMMFDMDFLSEGVDMGSVSWTMLSRFGEVPDAQRPSPPLSAELFVKYLSLAKRVRPSIPLEVAGEIHKIFEGWRNKAKACARGNDHMFDFTARLQDDFACMVVSSAMLHLREEVSLDDIRFVMPLFTHMLERWATVDGELDGGLLSVGLSGVEARGRSDVLGVLRAFGGLDAETLSAHVPAVVEEPLLLSRMVEEGVVIDDGGVFRVNGGRA